MRSLTACSIPFICPNLVAQSSFGSRRPKIRSSRRPVSWYESFLHTLTTGVFPAILLPHLHVTCSSAAASTTSEAHYPVSEQYSFYGVKLLASRPIPKPGGPGYPSLFGS
jgi:hypothetical protein